MEEISKLLGLIIPLNQNDEDSDFYRGIAREIIENYIRDHRDLNNTLTLSKLISDYESKDLYTIINFCSVGIKYTEKDLSCGYAKIGECLTQHLNSMSTNNTARQIDQALLDLTKGTRTINNLGKAGTGRNFIIKKSLLNLIELTGWTIIISDPNDEYKSFVNTVKTNRIVIKGTNETC